MYAKTIVNLGDICMVKKKNRKLEDATFDLNLMILNTRQIAHCPDLLGV